MKRATKAEPLLTTKQKEEIAKLEPKLESGPVAFDRFRNALTGALTVPKEDVDRAWQAQQAQRKKDRQKKAA